MKTWTVYWVGGERDGEVLHAYSFTDRIDAERFARDFYREHEDEFDPCCGGVGIEDEDGNVDMDW